ncbi:MAG: CBS domain-containing protein [Desulfurococcales archaeon]|nr:CBS domain-containing protein [Desulfurococcales archaeon]
MKGGGARRPPVKKVNVARVSRRVARPRVVVRPEGIRYLRADGTPEWRHWIPRREGETALIASRPPVTIAPQSTILEAAETIHEKKVRGLIVADPAKGLLKGLLTAMDLVNYLGGGEYYNIVVNRHKRNIYSALRDEYVESIANPTPLFVTKSEPLDNVVRLMAENGIGIIPVVYEDGTVYGVITEHDIVRHVAGKKLGVRVGDVATKQIITISIEATLKEAARKMTQFGFRRLPVLSEESGEIRGVVTAKDYVSFFGSHTAFKELSTTDIEEVLKIPVYEIMQPGIYTISEDADLGEAASAMQDNQTNTLFVTNEEGEIIGILTERDILLSIV